MYLTSKKILIFIKTYGLTKRDVKTIDPSANGREVAGNRERDGVKTGERNTQRHIFW